LVMGLDSEPKPLLLRHDLLLSMIVAVYFELSQFEA